jgi:hypothetical protein
MEERGRERMINGEAKIMNVEGLGIASDRYLEGKDKVVYPRKIYPSSPKQYSSLSSTQFSNVSCIHSNLSFPAPAIFIQNHEQSTLLSNVPKLTN